MSNTRDMETDSDLKAVVIGPCCLMTSKDSRLDFVISGWIFNYIGPVNPTLRRGGTFCCFDAEG